MLIVAHCSAANRTLHWCIQWPAAVRAFLDGASIIAFDFFSELKLPCMLVDGMPVKVF